MRNKKGTKNFNTKLKKVEFSFIKENPFLTTPFVPLIPPSKLKKMQFHFRTP